MHIKGSVYLQMFPIFEIALALRASQWQETSHFVIARTSEAILCLLKIDKMGNICTLRL